MTSSHSAPNSLRPNFLGPPTSRSTSILSIHHLSRRLHRIAGHSRTRKRSRFNTMDGSTMPGAFPEGPEDSAPVQRAPKKRFVGRRTLEAQGKLKHDANSSVEETTAVVQSSEFAPGYILGIRLTWFQHHDDHVPSIRFQQTFSKTPTSTPP